MNSWVTLLPPAIAITLAITTRQVYLAIAAGILAGSLLLTEGLIQGFATSFDSIAGVFQSPSTVKSLLFILSIGALTHVMQQSGGLRALINYLDSRRGLIRSKRSAQMITFLMGLLMCMEGVGSMMMVGLVGRPLFAKHHISKAKLAYIANSTGAPIAWLMPVSGAGVLLAGLVSTQTSSGVLSGDATSYVFAALPYQIYSILVLLSVPLLALLQHDFTNQGQDPLTTIEHSNAEHASSNSLSIANALVPLALLLGSIITICLVTGKGNLFAGEIGNAVYWSGFVAITGSGFYYRISGISLQNYITWCIEGCKNILPAVIILVLAMALSHTIGALGTGAYLAQLIATSLPIWLVPAAIFIIGMLISFSTGSSGAAVSILTPIAIVSSVHLALPIPLILGAVISGAVFGDQSSPISDSVIVASTAANCRPEQHFATQLPLTLGFASISVLCYLALGWTL